MFAGHVGLPNSVGLAYMELKRYPESMKFVTLIADGEHEIGIAPRSTTILVLLTGDFGTGTVTFGTFDKAGSFAEFTDPAAATLKSNVQVFLGKGTKLVISLAGSTAPDLQIGFAGDFFEFATDFNKIA